MCNKYFALSDGESYTLSADILNGGNDKITACFILLNQNKVLGASKKYEIESDFLHITRKSVAYFPELH